MVLLSEEFDSELQAGDQTVGGIVVPDGMKKRLDITKEPYRIATVEAVGPDVAGIVAGQRVLVRRVAVDQVFYDSRSYWFAPIGAVQAVVK